MEFVPYEEENPYLRKAYKENNYKIRYHGDSETGGVVPVMFIFPVMVYM